MPKKYRDVSRALRGAGWRKVRMTGSHEIWNPGMVVASQYQVVVRAAAKCRSEPWLGSVGRLD